MNRAYLVIAIPAVIVGAAYVALMVSIRADVNWWPFTGLAFAMAIAIFLVKRKADKEKK